MTPISSCENRRWFRLWDRLGAGSRGRFTGALRARLCNRLGDRIWDLYGRTLAYDSDID